MGIILSSAIEYFNNFGFSVIPSNRFKKPLVPWSENQKKKADLQQIVSWWKDFPSANVTLVTGRISNLFVIDCDNEEGFLKIQKMLPDDLVVPIAKTPRDGHHLWFSFPMETNLTVGELIPKVDFKGEGGCITSVPSVRDGKVYTWIIPPEPNNLPPVPPKLLEFILEKAASNNKYNSYINKENEVTEDDNTTKDNIHYNILQEGTRDNDLFHIANTMVKGGAKPEFTEQLLEIIAEKICIPPFPQREIKAKVKSAMSRIKRRDRNLADEVREYFLLQEGYTFTTDIQQTLQITTLEEKKNLTVILTRLLQDGIIERYGEKRGCYRPVNLQTKNMEFIEEAIPEFEIRLPFRMGDILSIYPKNIIILAGDKSAGKGHPDGTKILTPSGWENIENLKIGNKVFAQDGTITKINGVFPRGEQQCFKWEFSDRTTIETDFEHLWNVISPNNKYYKIGGHGGKNKKFGKFETIESYKLLALLGGFGTSKIKYRIPKNEPLQFGEKEVPVDPYLLGLMLGDGSLNRGTTVISTGDEEIIEYCKKNWEVGSVRKYPHRNCSSVSLLKMKSVLQKIGIFGHRSWEKLIPQKYLFNSIEKRKELLQGLMDTDGTISSNNKISFTTVSSRLVEDVSFLVRSLGGKVSHTSKKTIYRSKGEYKIGRLSYNLYINIKDFCPFKLKRKAERFNPSLKTDLKYFQKVENSGIKKTTCISIEHPSGLYVAQDFIITHNSAFCLNVAHMNQDLHPVHYLSSEMVEEEWSVRLKKWGISKKSEIRYQMEECSTDFHNKIGPDHKIYIVDYLEVNDNFWEIGKMIRKIHDKLRDGICFIAIQKKTNAYLGRGAEFSLEKARLYLSLDFMPKESCSKLTIVDAKAPRMGESIRGYWKKIKIIDSIKLSSEDNTWRT